MNANKRTELIAKIKQQGLPRERTTLPVVSLEDFFDGNDDYGSIGCNLPEHPSPRTFFELLNRIRSKPDVQDVLVEIMEVEQQDTSMWPFSERIYILTSAAREQVEDWVSELQPDDVGIGYAFGTPPAAPPLQDGIRVFSLWWD